MADEPQPVTPPTGQQAMPLGEIMYRVWHACNGWPVITPFEGLEERHRQAWQATALETIGAWWNGVKATPDGRAWAFTDIRAHVASTN